MIKMMLLGMALFVVTACGAAPSTQAGTSTAPTSTASSSPSTASTPPSPSATGEAPSAAANEDTMLCILTQSGGIAGATETVTVLVNGEVTVQRDRPTASTSTTQATPDQLDALRTAIESDEWQQLQGHYGRLVPDAFTYEVQCGGATVTTYDGAERPAILNELLTQLGTLRQQALQ